MAYRRRRKTAQRKKRPMRRARRSRRPRSQKLLTCPQGFPRRMFTATDYFYTSTTAVAGLSNYVIPVQSSAFQLISGLSNSQAQYFDQYKAIYTRYRVHALRVSVTANLESGVANQVRAMVFGGYWATVPTVPGTVEGAMVQPGAQYRSLPVDCTARKITSYNKSYRALNISKMMYDTDLAYQAAVTASPTTVAYYNIWFYNPQAAPDTQKVQYVIRIRAYVEYFQRELIVNT